MVTVRMKVQISGTRNGTSWPPKGATITLPPHEAQELIAQRLAEPAPPQSTEDMHEPDNPEVYATLPAEEEIATPARKRSRKRG